MYVGTECCWLHYLQMLLQWFHVAQVVSTKLYGCISLLVMDVCRVPKMVGMMELQLELQWYLLYQLQVMSICFFIQLSNCLLGTALWLFGVVNNHFCRFLRLRSRNDFFIAQMVSLISFCRVKVTLHSFCHIEPAVCSRSFFWCCYKCYVHTDYFKDFLILKNSCSYKCLFLFPCLTFTLSFPFCSSLFLVSFTFSFSFSFCWGSKHHGWVFPLLLVLWHWPPSAVGSWWKWGCCIRQSIAVPVKVSEHAFDC